MRLPSLLALAACSALSGCNQFVNLSPVSAPADALRPQGAHGVEVFDRGTPPDRPYSKYLVLETDGGLDRKAASADLRAKGGDVGCDAILLRSDAGKADCLLYNGK